MAFKEGAWIASALAAVSFAVAAGKPPTVQLGPGVIRSQAQMIVMPVYPPQSVQAGHSGVAVADIYVSTKGVVEEVKLLQAPDAAIGSEIVKAVSRWTFHPMKTMPDKTPVEIEGRLMFMFSLREGTPKVTDLAGAHSAQAH